MIQGLNLNDRVRAHVSLIISFLVWIVDGDISIY